MFRAIPKDIDGKFIEEISKETKNSKIDIKEKFIVFVIYLLIFLILTSFVSILYFSYTENLEQANLFKSILMYSLPALVAYILGYNKNK